MAASAMVSAVFPAEAPLSLSAAIRELQLRASDVKWRWRIGLIDWRER